MRYMDDMGTDKTSYVTDLEQQIVTLQRENEELKQTLRRIESFPAPPEIVEDTVEIIGGEKQRATTTNSKKRKSARTGQDSLGEQAERNP